MNSPHSAPFRNDLRGLRIRVAIWAIAVVSGMAFISPGSTRDPAPSSIQLDDCQTSLTSPTPPKAYTGPFVLSPGQYTGDFTQQLLDLQPLYVRVVAAGPNINTYDQQVEVIAQISEEEITKLVGFSSYQDLEEKLSQPGPEGFATHAEYLQSIGVIGFTYNTEWGSMGNDWTPEDEMQNIFNTDPESNSVVRFVNIVKSYGFDFILWVPYRYTADGEDFPNQKNPQAKQAFSLMYQAGLTGIGLQEQFLIDRYCVANRVAEFQETLQMHITAAGGTTPFILINTLAKTCASADQFAEQSCGLPPDHYPYQHCDQFIDQISAQVNAITLFDEPSQEMVDFIETLREGSVLVHQIYLPLSMKD